MLSLAFPVIAYLPNTALLYRPVPYNYQTHCYAKMNVLNVIYYLINLV